jgi:hypothetical protein
MASVDSQILSVCANISSNIDALAHDRALLAQNILSQLRNLVEALAVRLHQGDGSIEFSYDRVNDAIAWIGSGKKQISFLHRFHRLIQMSASHYTFEGDASERLMLKYYEYLLRIRALVQQHCGVQVLSNLSKFPVDLDPSLREYHQKIASKVDAVRRIGREGRRSRYYIHKVRPFFTDDRIFYEVTFSNATNKVSKFDRLIAFTDIDLTHRYAANLSLVSETIQVLNHTMPILVIQDWEVSIRPCELDNFAKVLGQTVKVNSGSSEYRALMHFLTATEGSLLELVDCPDETYQHIRSRVTQKAKSLAFFPVLDLARKLIRSRSPGTNVLRYLLLEMNNRIIKLQYEPFQCKYLSDLYLSASCKPFDDMPFCTSPRQHNPRFLDLAECLDMSGRAHELLARKVRNNVEIDGVLYTPKADLEVFGTVEQLVAEYNKRIYHKHTGRHLVIAMDHVFLRDYEDGTVAIIEKLREFAGSGVAGYQASVAQWLTQTQLNIDDEAKKVALQTLFTKSRVALIYGAAGTGKSTMVNYIANYFGDRQKLILAHTNPAIDNLKRKVSAQNTEFRTISSQKSRSGQQDFDVLIIDECSTVSNADLLKVLERTSFKLIVLVGDVFQIESIQFGNWFKIVRSFLPSESVFELVKPFRTHNAALLEFWTKVRNIEEGIEETIAHNGYSASLDESLFTTGQQDEIILCLNYDGLYGINNVNRFLQSGNTGKAVDWGVATYKVGDPVLFNDIERFKPFIYNNLKGWIAGIVVYADRIQFDVRLERKVTELDVDGVDLRYVDESTVQFDVFHSNGTDEDDDSTNTSVPFQVAYAVSIHKAQGLEYDSVKVVITEANEEDISHNIFYTAVTRTRQKLKIFWSPETQMAVLSSLESKKNGKDVALLKARKGW